MPEQTHPTGAVFLSYASQDTEAVERICEALRASGVEVWLDKSELRGGDAWDAQIKRQIHECTLFMPVISARTNERTEGYFRREWKLATLRLLDMADDAVFLVPVVIDETREADARVPEEFLHAQWTRLPEGETPPAFAHRVRQLLGGDRALVHKAQSADRGAHEPSARRERSAQSWLRLAGRGRHRVGLAGFALLALLLVLGGGAFWYHRAANDAPEKHALPTDGSVVGPVPAATTPAAAPAIADTRPSIAVLPFENRSRLDDDIFFVDGIHDDILTQLSKVSALKVISRTSVEQFRDTKLPTKAIAEQLGVKSIVEGAVQRAGDRVRINVQLIDAASDAHLWAESYDRELTATNIFAIQSEVAAAIAGALKATLTAGERARANTIQTQSLEAWEAYQLGHQRLARRTAAALTEAEAFFRRAIELDPKFAHAHTGLARSLILLTVYTDVQLAPTLDKAQQSVDTALKLDPGLSDAWVAAGMIAGSRAQYADAEKLLRRALELDPNNSKALLSLAQTLSITSRLDEAVTTVRQAADLDPLSAIIQVNLGSMLGDTGDFADAATRYRRAIEIDPALAVGYVSLSQLLAYGMNRFVEAVPLARKAADLDPGAPRGLSNLAVLYFALGDDRSFVETIGQAASRWPDEPNVHCVLGIADLERGDAAGMLQHAQRAADADSRDYSARRCGLFLLRDRDLRDGRYDRALERYRKAYPELFLPASPRIDRLNYLIAVEVVPVLQALGRTDEAHALLDGIERTIRPLPRVRKRFGITDVQVLSLRAETGKALAALRDAEREGWRDPFWRYARDVDPTLASIRDDLEFKAVFADIERDMARQRAALAARPKDAPLDHASGH